MNECKHKVTGEADWVGACPYCKIEQLEMDQVFYRLAIKERDYERERNARLIEERDIFKRTLDKRDAERDRMLSEQGRQARDMMAMQDEIERLRAERDALKADLLLQALKWSELADRAELTTAAQAETKVWKKLADANAKDAEKWKADYESVSKLMNMWGKIFNRDQVERYAVKIGVDPDELIARTNAAIDAARGE